MEKNSLDPFYTQKSIGTMTAIDENCSFETDDITLAAAFFIDDELQVSKIKLDTHGYVMSAFRALLHHWIIKNCTTRT